MKRRTKQRDAIQRAIEIAARPLAPHEILAEASTDAPQIGMATVYRAILDLQAEGWLKEVELPGESSRYERAGLDHHHHFHCRECDRVYDLPGCPGALRELAPPAFRVDEHEIILYGRCPQCS
jgi:Fur family ferric uptake transcriptional regulator